VPKYSKSTFYNYTIVGAGASGLWLANAMFDHGLLDDKTLCIVESDEEKFNDRTWCYWAEKPIAEPEIISKEWNNIKSLYQENKSKISPYKYYHVRSQDFYQHIKNKLKNCQSIYWINDTVISVDQNLDNHILIKTVNRNWKSSYAFLSAHPQQSNSAQNEKQIHYLGKEAKQKNQLFLWQSFVGYRIKTTQPIFDTSEITMMDFDVDQSLYTQFFYELPFSENEVLVEFTRFGTEVLDYDYAISEIEKRLNNKNIEYEILEIEKGSIPMTPQFDCSSSTLKNNQHIIYIGTLAGALKPTTGYGFKRMYYYAEELAKSLKQPNGKNLPTMKRKWRFRLYDILLLQILKDKPYLGKDIFITLFKRQPIPLILKFLDEETNIYEEVSIFSRLPILPFLKSLFKYFLSK
jgi:lycopene beta-cyclase